MSFLTGALTWVAARLKEPSSYAGLAAFFTSLATASSSPTAMTVGTALAGFLAFVMPESAAAKGDPLPKA